MGLSTNVPRLRLGLAVLRLGRVVFAFVLRAGLGRRAVVGGAVVTGVLTGLVMLPLAAVIGALTVVTVLVVVTVLNVMVTGPHVMTIGSVLVNVTCPH
jgi:hypothetical protein